MFIILFYYMRNRRDLHLIKTVYIRSKNAEAVPPLGTILGNIGVNTVKFCDEFNKFTNILPSYLVIKVNIFINENRTFNFIIDSFSVTYALNILKFKQIVKVCKISIISEKEVFCIKLKDVLHLCLYKFPKKTIKQSFFVLLGLIKSMKIYIIK